MLGDNTVEQAAGFLRVDSRDPRPEFKTASFRDGVEDLKDLEPGMQPEGVVKVLEVNVARKRVALTMRLTDELPAKRDLGAPPPRRGAPAPLPKREAPPQNNAMTAALAKLMR